MHPAEKTILSLRAFKTLLDRTGSLDDCHVGSMLSGIESNLFISDHSRAYSSSSLRRN